MALIYSEAFHGPDTQEKILSHWAQCKSGKSTPLFLLPPHLKQLPKSTLLDPDKVPRGAFGLFTSGTVSGSPRPVIISRNNIEASLESILALFDQNQIKTVFCYPQPFHVFGLVLGYLLADRLGAKLITAQGKYSHHAHEKWLETPKEGLLTLGTPTHFFDLLTLTKSRPDPSYSCIVGGAPVSREMWVNLRDRLGIKKPSIGYGCTEASPGITHLAPGVEPQEDYEIGSPLAGVTMSTSPEGVSFSGSNLCHAFLDTQSSPPNWKTPTSLTIPDLVEKLSLDRYRFMHRLGLSINRGGAKYQLEAIESSLHNTLGVRAIAWPKPDARLGQELNLCIEGIHTPNTILSHIESEFGIKLKPHDLHFVPKLPQNASGKPDRKAAPLLRSSESLSPIIPHRPPMVWIDQVTEVHPDKSVCSVTLKSDGAYFSHTLGSDPEVTEACLLEFMAQGFAFTQAALVEARGQSLKLAFLASVRRFYVENQAARLRLKPGHQLEITVMNPRQLGDSIPLLLSSTTVYSPDLGEAIARGELTVYAETE